MSSEGINAAKVFLDAAPKDVDSLNQTPNIAAFKDNLQKLTKHANDEIKERAWQTYRKLFGLTFIHELLASIDLTSQDVEAILLNECESPLELFAAIQGANSEGISQMETWKQQFNGMNPWKLLLEQHPDRMIKVLAFLAKQQIVNLNLDNVNLILKNSQDLSEEGTALCLIDFLENSIKSMVEHNADVKEFEQLLQHTREFIFNSQLKKFNYPQRMDEYIATKDNLIKLAKTYNHPAYGISLLRKLPKIPFIEKYIENKEYGVDSELRDEAHWLSALYYSQSTHESDLKINEIIVNLNSTYQIDDVIAIALIENLTEFFEQHPRQYLEEDHLDFLMNKLLFSGDKSRVELQEKLIHLILTNIKNKQRVEAQYNQEAEGRKVPYFSLLTQNIDFFDSVRKHIEKMESKECSVDEIISLFQAPQQDPSSIEYKSYLTTSRNWNAFLLENRNLIGFTDIFEFNKANVSDISMLAQACQMILDKYDNIQNKNPMQDLRNKCIAYAALRNDKWAMGKLHLLETEQRKAIELCLKAIDDIDEKKARLYDAYHAKGYARYEYSLGFGTKKSIQSKIDDLKKAKSNIADKAFASITDKNSDVQDMIKNETKQPFNRYRLAQRRNRTAKMAITALGLGIPYVINKIWKGLNTLRDKIGYYVLGKGTVSMSGYKYWRKNYHVITDYLNGNSKPLLEMKEKDTAHLNQLQNVKDYLAGMKIKLIQIKLSNQSNQASEELETLLDLIASPPEKARKDIIEKHTERATQLKEVLIKQREQLAESQAPKDKIELAKLDQVIADMPVFEKMNPYEESITKRRIEHLEKHEQIKARTPWLKAQEKFIETEDGKFCDVLHVQNAKNNGRTTPKKYAIFFSGAEVTYFLDTRHFDYSDNLEVDVLAVQNRGMTEGGKAKNMTASDLAKDGCAVINDLIKQGVNPEDISIIGYCGGSPAATLTTEMMQKKYNQPVKLVLDRTFASVSDIAKDKIDKYKKSKPKESRFLPARLAKWGSSRVLKLVGWEVNIAKKVEALPADQFMYYGILPQRKFLNPESNQKAHGVDRTVPHERSLHKGLKHKRKAIKNNLHQLESELYSLADTLGISIRPDNIDFPEDKALQQLQSSLFYLLQVIQFQNKYLKSPNVDAGIGDELHVANMKDFKLRDGTKLADMVKAHIHGKSTELDFVGGFVYDKVSPEGKAIAKFNHLAKKSFAINKELGLILERQFPDAAVSLSLALNLAVGQLVDHANKSYSPEQLTKHHKRKKQITHFYKKENVKSPHKKAMDMPKTTTKNRPNV